MIRLSERLEKIAEYVGESQSIADIGTDHAYLPIYIAQCAVAKKAILTDINEGPLQKAKQNHGKYLSNDDSCEFFFREGDGLCPVSNGEVDTAIIAGMGGELIIDILSHDPAKTESIGKFILQPRTKCDELRNWICEQGYSIIAEDLAKERGKICEIIVFSSAKELSTNTANNQTTIKPIDEKTSDSISNVGICTSQLDYLLKNDNPLLKDYLTQKINTEKGIIMNLAKSKRQAEAAITEIKEREALSKERIEIYSDYLHNMTRTKLL